MSYSYFYFLEVTMSIINIKNLSFNYDGSHDNIFENVSLQIDTNWKLGLVGRNGKGKTTLLKLLLGDLEYRGNIQSSVKFEYFPFSINNKDISVYEAIKIIDSNYEEWKILKELTLLDFYDIDFYRPFSTYSNGEQTKIMLAVLFSKDNSFLLIDEPTNHLDRKGREVLAKYLSRKSSYIIVSHDKMFLDNCIDHVMSINRENIELQSGNLSSYLENKNYQDAYEFSENEKLKTEIARLEESTKRTKDWANKNESTKIGFDPTKVEKNIGRRAYVGSKTKKMMKQSKVLEQRNNKAIAEKSLLLKNIDREETLKIQGVEFFKENLIAVKDLIIIYNGHAINQPLSFEVNQGDRVSLVGKNGSGKTSVLKAILGLITSYSGTVEYNKQLKMSYVSQDTSFVKGSLDEYCQENEVDKTNLLNILFKLGFERIQFQKLLQDFSEGQKKKLLIAKSLCTNAHLYIWDEPLNYIDIISREQIKDMILRSKVSMIFVEHDGNFCDELSTKEIKIQ